MVKVFIDTCALMDYFLSRDNCEMKRILSAGTGLRFYVSALTVADFAYLARKELKGRELKAVLSELFKILDVLPLSDQMIYDAQRSVAPDYEDSLQILCAEYRDCDVILTSNVKHFRKYTEIPVMTPSEFIAACKG